MNKFDKVEIKSWARETTSVVNTTALLLWQKYSYRGRIKSMFYKDMKISHLMITNRPKEGTWGNSMKNSWVFLIWGPSTLGHMFWSDAAIYIYVFIWREIYYTCLWVYLSLFIFISIYTYTWHPENTAKTPNHHSQNITGYGDNWHKLLPWSASSSFSRP